MKKTLSALMVIAFCTGITFAANQNVTLKDAIKRDVNQTKQAIKKDISNSKEAAKKDSQARQQAQNDAAKARKAEKVKQIDSKLKDLNAQMKTVKNDKNITETERTMKTRSIQRQIDFYTKQKEALK